MKPAECFRIPANEFCCGGAYQKREEQTPLAGVMPLSERPENRALISLQQWIKLTPAFDESKAGGL
jgi:hypothetical protein